MKTKNVIRARIKRLRVRRDDAKQFTGTEGYVFLCNGAIRALEWILGYKRKPQFWCYRCALLHNNLKCPKCGNETERIIDEGNSNVKVLRGKE